MAKVKLKSLKHTKAESKDRYSPKVSEGPHPSYPYGTELRLEHDTLKKLGIKGMPRVGSKVKVHAVGVVTSASQHERKGGKPSRSVEVQLHKMSLEHREAKSTLEAVEDGVDEANADEVARRPRDEDEEDDG